MRLFYGFLEECQVYFSVLPSGIVTSNITSQQVVCQLVVEKKNKIHANLMIGTNLADTYRLEGEHFFRFVQVLRLHNDAGRLEL
jgi:hypothetical protein